MSSIRRMAVSVLLLATFVLGPCVLPAAMAKPSQPKPKQERVSFRIIRHTKRFDVVRGHKQKFRVRDDARRVTVRGVGSFKVLSRTSRYVVLASSRSAWVPQPTITTPNSGTFVNGSAYKVTWRVWPVASSGYFNVSLRSDSTGSSIAVATQVPVNRRASSYGVIWATSQPAGAYHVRVEYVSSAGTVLSSDESNRSVSVADATPTPIPTPTPTPTTTPTSTATSTAPGPAAGTVFTQRGALHLTSGHDLVYDGIDFEGAGYGSGDWGALVFLEGRGDLYNITFRNCIFGTNTEGTGNGVKLVDLGGGRMHDITFDHCHFAYQPRMGFEMIGRSIENENGVGGQGYLRVNVTNCTFEASAGEAISYDANVGDNSGYCTVSGNVVQGAGVGTRYTWGKVFEINGTHNMTVTGNYFGAGRDGILNLQMHDTDDCGWLFSDNTVDATHIPAGVTPTRTAQPVVAFNVHGGVFPGNTIINKDSWNIAYLSGCHDMDWRSTEWLGPENLPYQTGCSGNQF